MTINVQRVVRKCDLCELSRCRGARNDAELVIDGTTYPIGALCFLGFRGAMNVSDGLYHGDCILDTVEPAAHDIWADFSILLGLNRTECD